MDPIETVKVYTIIHTHSYRIYVGKHVYEEIGEVLDMDQYSQIIILTDTQIAPFYLEETVHKLRKFNKNISSFKIEPGEQHKTLETVSLIYKFLIKQQADKKTLLVNLGGGVISDIGGYVASTFLRGMPFINLPTTLEGMIDASVGGKTGINFEEYKNYIGTFAQPEGVFAEVTTLQSLPERVFLQGQAEAIKHGLIADASYFEKVTSKKINEFPEDQLIELIAQSIQIKADFVHKDEKEDASRKLLHFGHIIGHALESLSQKTSHPLYHGEAVAIGMVAEAKISEQLGMLSERDFETIEQSIANVGLPIRYPNKTNLEKVLKLVHADKKSIKGKIKWSLLTGIGKADFNIEIGEKFIKDGIAYILQDK